MTASSTTPGAGTTRHRSGPDAADGQRALRYAAFAVIYLGWGSTYLAIRLMVQTMPPLLGAGARFLTAGVILAAWVRVRRGSLTAGWRRPQWTAVAVTALLLVVGGPGLTTVAERDVPSGLAALLVASVPLWVVLWRLVFREHVGVPAMAGTALGLVGTGVLVWPDGADAVTGTSAVGVALLIVVALSYATGSFLSPRLAMPGDVFAVSAVQMLLAGAVVTAAGLVAGEGQQVDLAAVTPASWWALAYLIGPGSLLTHTANIWLLARVPVSRVATHAYVNPVVAVTLGWLVLSEPISARMLLGAVVSVVAVAVVITTTPS